MAVVINEFEVVAEPAAAPAAEEAPAEVAPVTVLDIERAVRWQRERLARVWAH